MSVMERLRRRPARADGQTLVIFALFLVVLIGAAALTIDYGTWLKARRDYQNAADSAALQGATFLTKPISSTKQVQGRKAAWASLNRQLLLGLSDGTLDTYAAGNTTAGAARTDGGYRMWVSTSPNGAGTKYSGAQGANPSAMFVLVERDNPSFFARVFSQGDRNVGAWATAGAGPNRFAVITLRHNGDPTNGNPTDIDINGGTVLTVKDGDVGGNWGMAINGNGSAMVFASSTSDQYGLYLTENVPTGGNGWTAGQVRDGSGTPVTPAYLPEVLDPAYPAPCLTYGVGVGNGCLEDRGSVSATTSRSVDACPVAGTVDRLPSGRYNNISIPNGKCLVLDPTLNAVNGKESGIYYITGTLDMNNSALLIGNGVTIIFARGGNLNMNSGASMSVNSGTGFGAAACGANCKYGAWTTKGGLQWSLGSPATYLGGPADSTARGLALYVCKSVADCGSGSTPSTNIFQMNSTGTGVDYQGLVYAPLDNVKIAGQPTHKDIGQLVAWTVQFTGGVAIDQTYDGPDSGTPFLLEPTTGQ